MRTLSPPRRRPLLSRRARHAEYIRRPAGPETFRHQDTASLDSEARPEVSEVPAVEAAAAWHRPLPYGVRRETCLDVGALAQSINV